MRESNTPGVGAVLDAHGFESIPEAHCYLKYDGRRIDLTGLPSGRESPFSALLSEEAIEPRCLLTEKIARHRNVLDRWARARGYDPEHVWSIREQCIAALTQQAASAR